MSYQNSSTECITSMAGPGAEHVQELNLASKTAIDLGNADLTLICLDGEIWLTCDRDPEDHIVGCCQRFAIKKGDKAVAYALRKSRVRLVYAGVAQNRGSNFLARIEEAVSRLNGSNS